jgi:RHS repeat-associated protein
MAGVTLIANSTPAVALTSHASRNSRSVSSPPIETKTAKGKSSARKPRQSQAENPTTTGTDTPGIDPDTYSCAEPGYIDFENLPDGTDLSANSIDGVQFTTTNGYTWLVGDFATGNYNGKYPDGDYTSQGTHWAWLGPDEGEGIIQFVGGPTSYFSLLTSANTSVELDAYDSANNEIAVAGPITPNIDTGTMDQLAITSTSANIAYVIVHDDGNYFLVDSVCTNAANVPGVVTNGVLQGGGAPDVPPTTCSSDRPVNCVTGEFWHSFSDLSVPGRGLPLDLTRTYSSSAASTLGPFGYGWTDSYNMFLSFDTTGDATVHENNGSYLTAANTPSGYEFSTYVPDTLVENMSGTYTFTQKDGSQDVFSSSGQLETETDRNGYTTSLSYNGSNQITSVKDPAGRSLTFTYGSNGLVSTVTDPASRTVSYAYDASDNLISATDAGGGKWSFTYDPNHLMLTMTDPDGGVTTNTYDSSARVLSQTDPMGRETTYSYSAPAGYDGTTSVTDPLGNVTLYQYASDELTSVTHAYGTADAATWTYVYDPSTLGITSATDPDGNVTTYAYDSSGNLLSKTDQLGRTTSYTYNTFNEPLTVTDPTGVTTTKTYDSHGNLLTTSTPLTGTSTSATTSYIYGDSSHPGDVTAVKDPDGNTTDYTYDTDGNKTSTTDPDGHETTSTYNTIGEKTSSFDGLGHKTSYAYDALGDLLSTTDPLGHVTTNTYDADQNLLSTTDPEGNKTSYAYDADNELTKTTSPDGSSSQKSYDANGNVASTTNGDGDVTTNTYDSLNRLSSTTDPLGKVTSYTYDPDGNLLTTTDASGRTTTNTYDGGGELTSVSYSDGVTPDVSYTYDADGRRLSMTDGTGTTSYTYDSLGRLVASTDGAGAKVSYGYDLDSQLISLTYPNGKVVTEAYDAAGNLTSVTDWLGHKNTFTYDADNNLLSENTGPSPTVTDTYTYDADSGLTTITDKSKSKTVQSFTYTRTPDDLIASATPNGTSPETYSYDSQNQLTKDAQGSYTYDPAGDVTQLLSTVAMTYNAASELTSSGTGTKAITYAYDAEGDRISATPHKGKAASYTYDQAGRLIGFKQKTTTASYVYNGDGLRMSKKVGATAVAFTWDTVATTPLLLFDGTTSYLYGPGGLPLEQITGSTPVFIHHDQLGSTTLLTGATGKKLATFTYDSYGSLKSHTGKTATPLLYAGQYQDSESGLYYLRARYYDPATGQFLSVDPLKAVTGTPDAYVQDDPENLVDPTGLSWWNPFSWSASTWAVVGAVAAVVTVAVVLCVATACLGDAAVGAAALGGADAAADAGGISVIGSLAASPSYIDVAESLGANYFYLDDYEALTTGEQWAANQEFLDQAIARGDTFVLSSPPELAPEGSGYFKELQYLLENGYTFEGDTLVPSASEIGSVDLLPILAC